MDSRATTTLNEQDSLQDMLECEKQLMGYYAESVQEGSDESLRNNLFTQYTECAKGQFTIFSQMKQRGYYTVPPAQKGTLDQKIQQFERVEKQLAQN